MDDETPIKTSDQLPEEAPADHVPDDVPDADEGAAREAGREHAGQEAQRTSDAGYRGTEEERAYEHAKDSGD